MERYCLHCNTVLHGRADKKFCDDSCRSTYYFESGRTGKDIVRTTNAILKKNRQILKDLTPTGKAKLAIHKLTEQGFNFDFFTGIYETNKGDRYYYCYDMGYLILSEKLILLVTKDGYNN